MPLSRSGRDAAFCCVITIMARFCGANHPLQALVILIPLRGRHSCCSHFTEEETEAQRGQESPYLNAGQSDAKDCSVQGEGKLEVGENESGF